MRRIIVLFGVLIACAALSGCLFRDPPAPTAVSYRTTARAAQAMRVAVLPAAQGAGVGRSALVVDDALVAGLRELARHEVVAIDRATAARLLPGDPLYANRLDAATLLALRDAVGADAVLIARVERFATYDPCSLAVTAHLIDCGDGSVLWSATAHLDGQRTEVQEDVRLWHDRLQGAALPGIGGWQADLVSPSRFARYACDRMLGTLDPEVRRTVLRIPIIGVVL